MGRSYWFECAKCGYRAKVSGRPDRGLSFHVQTILCRDCKELFDAVTRVRVPAEFGSKSGGRRFGSQSSWSSVRKPPTFQAALSRLLITGERNYQWIQFPPQCPVLPFHRVQEWNDPDKCPRCGIFMEKNVLPFRIWE
jgi:hypothetical protein